MTRRGVYALKVARPHLDMVRLTNALAAQQVAMTAGVPAPRLLGHKEDAVSGRAAYVEDWVAGKDAEEAWPRLAQGEREHVAWDFGRAVAQMHSTVGPCFSDDVLLTRVVPSWTEGLRRYLSAYVERVSAVGLPNPSSSLARRLWRHDVTQHIEELQHLLAVLRSFGHH